MNIQELIDALNEQWEKKIDNIKAEIKEMELDCVCSPTLSIYKQAVLQIIDEHIEKQTRQKVRNK